MLKWQSTISGISCREPSVIIPRGRSRPVWRMTTTDAPLQTLGVMGKANKTLGVMGKSPQYCTVVNPWDLVPTAFANKVPTVVDVDESYLFLPNFRNKRFLLTIEVRSIR